MRWGRLAFVALTVAGIAVLTAGYTLQRGAHDALGQEIQAMERKEKWAKEQANLMKERLTRLRRSDAIFRKVQEMGLDLTNIVPTQRRVVPLLDFPSPTPAPPVLRGGPASSSTPRNREAGLRPLTGAATPSVPATR